MITRDQPTPTRARPTGAGVPAPNLCADRLLRAAAPGPSARLRGRAAETER